MAIKANRTSGLRMKYKHLVLLTMAGDQPYLNCPAAFEERSKKERRVPPIGNRGSALFVRIEINTRDT